MLRVTTFRNPWAVAAVIGLAGCALDWSTKPDRASLGTGEDAGGDTGRDPSDAASDAAADTSAVSPPCSAAAARVVAARTAAQACRSGPTACSVAVEDECGCKRFAFADDTQAAAWRDAISALLAAGCTPTCAGPCPFAPLQGLCLQAGAGALACSP